MDKLKSNSYRQRSFSNCGLQGNKQTLQASLQSQYNSIQQQQQQHHLLSSIQQSQQQYSQNLQQSQQQQQQQYPTLQDEIKQQDNNRRISINQLKCSTQVQDQNNNSINVHQNYRSDYVLQNKKINTQSQLQLQQCVQDSFQSSIIPFSSVNTTSYMNQQQPQLQQQNQQNFQQQNQQQSQLNSIQFCKNFVEFLKCEDSKKWLDVTEQLNELSQMVELKLQHKQIYDKSQKIIEFISFNAEFIPKKFDILLSCLTQEFQNLRELYRDIQEKQNNNSYIGTLEEQNNELQSYQKWYDIIENINYQYYKIFSRHIQSFNSTNLLISKKSNMNKNNNSNSSSYIQSIPLPRSSSKNNNNPNTSIYINQTFNNNNKENTQKGNNNNSSQKQVTLEEYQSYKRERIIDKYSNENTLNLKIQQLEKQVKQLQTQLQSKIKDNEQIKQEKSRTSQQIELLQNKVQDLEKNLIYNDPSRFTSLRTGESEYLIKRHEVEKNELKRIIEQKNQEIKSYRIELEGILGEVDQTSRNQTENTSRNKHF